MNIDGSTGLYDASVGEAARFWTRGERQEQTVFRKRDVFRRLSLWNKFIRLGNAVQRAVRPWSKCG